MAKKIIEEIKPTEDLAKQVIVPEATSTEIQSTETPPTVNTPVANKPQDIDEGILRVLKTYPEYKELYVDSNGGAFTPATPKSVLGKAVLYQNPYFKTN